MPQQNQTSKDSKMEHSQTFLVEDSKVVQEQSQTSQNMPTPVAYPTAEPAAAVHSLSISGFQTLILNDRYEVVDKETRIGGNFVYWNTLRTFFVYCQGENRRWAISP